MRIVTSICGIAVLLSGCAAVAGGGSATPPAAQENPGGGECDAAGVQGFVGQPASAETGATLLRLTGARSLRWVPPRTAVTMDYRFDRLTVSYDDNLIIERITCG